MLWVLDELKKIHDGDFYLPTSVKHEIIDRPIESKKFKLEALQVLETIRRGTLKVYPQEAKLKKLTLDLLDLANSCYSCKGKGVTIIHYAEMEAVALALLLNADAMVVDERMMRAIIEDPLSVERIMSRKFSMKIKLDKKKLKLFKNEVKGIKLIRSVELATVAYEKGWLDVYLPKKNEVKNPRKTLLTAFLWGLKLRGCAISQAEIDKIVKLEL